MTASFSVPERPRRTRGFTHTLGHAFLKAIGWRLEGAPPAEDRFVLVAAPHTSNWDLIVFLALAYAYGFWPSWMAKRELFVTPLGPLLRWLGGIPIDRRARHDVVTQMAQLFERTEHLMLTITPEATRSAAEYWKTGFYHIAVRAKVPLVLGFLDFKNKVGGFGPSFYPTGDIHADMEQIRAFYEETRAVTAFYPDKFAPIRIRPDA